MIKYDVKMIQWLLIDRDQIAGIRFMLKGKQQEVIDFKN